MAHAMFRLLPSEARSHDRLTHRIIEPEALTPMLGA